MLNEEITSLQNPKIKNLLLLQKKSSERREQGVFVVEGLREIKSCMDSGYSVLQLFFCPGILKKEAGREAEDILQSHRGQHYLLSEKIYEKVAYRGSTEGIIALVKYKQTDFGQLHLKKNPLIVVLESVEKPGNLGAILRTADASRVDAVIVCDPLTDIYNPNLIRASLGGIFTVPTIVCSSEEAISWLKSQGISILTAQLQDSSYYYDIDMKRATAIVLGTESTGLSRIWRDASDAKIKIPMLGRLDSLNVSISAAILCFEAVKQRMQ